MKKVSIGRSSKGPIRLSNRASTRGNAPPDPSTRSSSRPRTSSESRLKTHIPVLKLRGSSCERDSRSRARAIDLSGRKKRSTSYNTPSTPAMQHLENPLGFSSCQSVRSRSGSRGGSAERGFKPHKAKLTDTRPIKDPGFQHRAMVRVYNYFQTQPQAIRDLCPSPNTRSVMIQSFVDIMGHLLHHFFNNHGIYKKNYIEEIPKLMKKLYYPGAISSSWLKTVNAPHAWPHVVAVMSWLVDLVVQRKSMGMEDFFPQAVDPVELSINTRVVFYSILQSFKAWNAADDARSDELDLALRDALKASQGFTDEEAELLARANAELAEELDDPEDRRATECRDALAESVRTLAAREKAAAQATAQRRSNIAQLEQKLADHRDRLLQLEHSLQLKTKKRDDLAKKVTMQSMTPEDAKAIKEEISSIEQEIKNNDAYLSEQQKITCADDMKMAFLKKKLNDMCVDFNKEILQSNCTELHKLTVKTNLNFFERDLDKARSEMHKIHVGLETLKSQLCEDTHKVDCSLEKQNENLKELKTEKKRVSDRMSALKEEQVVKEKELQALEANIEKMLGDFKAEYDALTAKIAQLVKSMPDINGITMELHKSHAKESECQQNMEEMVKMAAEFLQEQGQALAQYKSEIIKNASQVW